MTNNAKKVVRMPCIYYPVWFKKSHEQVKILLNNSNEINAISPGYIEKLGFKIWKTNIGAQKINSSILETFRIVIIDFQIENKISRPRFFQKTCLVANIKFEVILKIFFLKISNTDISFGKEIFT